MNMTKQWYAERRLSSISLALSILELITIVGAGIAMTFVHYSGPGSGERPIPLRLAALAWLFGGLGSIGIAFLTLIYDSRRSFAVFALLLAIPMFSFCSLSMIV